MNSYRKLPWCALGAIFAVAVLCSGALAQDQPGQPAAEKKDASTPAYSIPDAAKRAEAFYDYTMGHVNEIYFMSTNRADYAAAALDFYKKAYALDPSSPEIADHLAETYDEAHRVDEAISEAQGLLQKDPDNLPARRLLVQIYLRALRETNSDSGQQIIATRAVEQLEQIRRLDPNDTNSELELAELYGRLGNSQKAEDTLQDLLQKNPGDQAATELQAELLIAGNHAPEAINVLKGALAKSPSAQLFDLLGEADGQVHDFAGAEQAFSKATEMDPDEPAHRRGLAQALATEGKLEDALAQYERLAEMEPDDPDNYLRMAELDSQMHKLDDAEKNILQAKERAPGNLQVIYDEALIYEAQGRYNDAIQSLSGAVASIKSEHPVPSSRRELAVLYEGLGRLYRDAEKYPDAITTFQTMAQLGDEEARRADLLIVDTYRDEKDMTHALDEANKAVAQFPDDHDLLIARAMLYGDQGNADQALSQLRALLTHSPNDLEIDLRIAQVDKENHKYADAEAVLGQSESLATSDPEREMVWYALGGVYEQQKKHDQAEQQFKRVLAADPHYAPALNDYGYMLADRGVRLDEATDMIKRALAEDPTNSAYLDSLGWAYYKQDKLAEAEDLLRQAVQHDHNDATMLEHLGDIYFKRGKFDLAAEQWEHSLEEWRRALPTEVEPDKVAALEAKLNSVKQRLAQQHTPGSGDNPIQY
jgi:tetratricopeptide (TPR) repeat protein